MNCERFETMIDDYVDATLVATDHEEAERHLVDCATCREAVEETRELLHRVADLPRSIDPPRDLMPEIRRAIEPDEPARRQASPWVVWGALAASLALVSTAGLLWMEDRGEPTAPSASVGSPAAGVMQVSNLPQSVLLAEQDYIAAADHLLELIDQKRDRFAPATLETVERNIAIIDGAIEEIRVALEQTPGDPANERVLHAMYRQKLDVLRNISRIAG